jgi:hypothetical protein
MFEVLVALRRECSGNWTIQLVRLVLRSKKQHKFHHLYVPYSKQQFHWLVNGLKFVGLLASHLVRTKSQTMAKLARLVIGGVALASLYSTCLDAITSVRVARSFGASYETCLLRLDILALRLSRWGESVRILGDSSRRPKYEFSIPSPKEADTVQRLLGAIAVAFEDAKAISDRHCMKEKGP